MLVILSAIKVLLIVLIFMYNCSSYLLATRAKIVTKANKQVNRRQ